MKKDFYKLTLMLAMVMFCGSGFLAQAFTIKFENRQTFWSGWGSNTYIVATDLFGHSCNHSGDKVVGDLLVFDEMGDCEWTAPEGKEPTSIYFHNNNGRRTWDMSAVDGKTYTNAYVDLCLRGEAFEDDVQMTTENGVDYKAEMVSAAAGKTFVVTDLSGENEFSSGKKNMAPGTYDVAYGAGPMAMLNDLNFGSIEFSYLEWKFKVSDFAFTYNVKPANGSISYSGEYYFGITYSPEPISYEAIGKPEITIYKDGVEIEKLELTVRQWTGIEAYLNCVENGAYKIVVPAGSYKVKNEQAGKEMVNEEIVTEFTVAKPEVVRVTPENGSNVDLLEKVEIEFNAPLNVTNTKLFNNFEFIIDGSYSNTVEGVPSFSEDGKTITITLDATEQEHGEYEFYLTPVFGDEYGEDLSLKWNVKGNLPYHKPTITPKNNSTVKVLDKVAVEFDTDLEAGTETQLSFLKVSGGMVYAPFNIEVDGSFVVLTPADPDAVMPAGSYSVTLKEKHVKFANGDKWKDIILKYTIDPNYVPTEFTLMPDPEEQQAKLEGFTMFFDSSVSISMLVDEPVATIYDENGEVYCTGELEAYRYMIDCYPEETITKAGKYTVKIPADTYSVTCDGNTKNNEAIEFTYDVVGYIEPEIISITPEDGSELDAITSVVVEFNKPIKRSWAEDPEQAGVECGLNYNSWTDFIYPNVTLSDDGKTMTLTFEDCTKPGKYELEFYPAFADNTYMEQPVNATYTVKDTSPAHEYTVTPESGTTISANDIKIVLEFDAELVAGEKDFVNFVDKNSWLYTYPCDIVISGKTMTITPQEGVEIPFGDYKITLNNTHAMFANGDNFKEIKLEYTVYDSPFKYQVEPSNAKPLAKLDGINIYYYEPDDAKVSTNSDAPKGLLYGPDNMLVEEFDLVFVGNCVAGSFSKYIDQDGTFTVVIPADTYVVESAKTGAREINNRIEVEFQCLAYIEPQVISITPESGSELEEITVVKVEFNKPIDTDWANEFASSNCAFLDENFNPFYPAVALENDGKTLVLTYEDINTIGVYTSKFQALFADQTNSDEICIEYKVVDPSGIGTINADENATYYNIQGVKVTNPTKGIYIKVNNNTVTKVTKK